MPKCNNCPLGTSGVECPAVALPSPRLCNLVDPAHRDHNPDYRSAILSMVAPIRDAVNACPDRGGVLPLSMQDECGCVGKELSGCRAGKGEIPGRVTLRDCLECRASAIIPSPPRSA